MKNWIPIAVIIGSFAFLTGWTSIEKEIEQSKIITLEHALKAALEKHPGLAASRHEIKARKGAAGQAGMLPNPSLSGEIEEFGGSGDYSGTNLMAYKVGISQAIPLGGQISKRIQAAEARTDIAMLEHAAQTLALRTEVRKRFLRVYILQEQLKLETKNLTLLEELREAVVKRVASGEVSPLDETKVMVQVASSGIAVKRTKRELDAAKYVLASSWADDIPKFSEVWADYQTIITVPTENELLEILSSTPAYGILEKNVALSSASLDLARAEAWMDLEVGGGIQHFNESNDHAWFLGLSIPIPLFDRNKGRIEETRQMRGKAIKDQEAGLIALKTSLLETAKRLNSAQDAFLTMQNTVMPAAKKAFISVRKAYKAGEQDYLELLEAQRTLLDTRHEQLALFAELQELIAELDGLTTGNLKKGPKNETKKES